MTRFINNRNSSESDNQKTAIKNQGSDKTQPRFQKSESPPNEGPSSSATTPRFKDLNEPSPKPGQSSESGNQGGKTRIQFPSSKEKSQKEHENFDPVVSWVVIVAGPGKGASFSLLSGKSSVGRNESNDVGLNFGINSDEKISREKHCFITYDPRGRKFYILPGDGRNLAYIQDSPVLQPTEITSGDEIQLGDTILRFVPFCGADFSWD